VRGSFATARACAPISRKEHFVLKTYICVYTLKEHINVKIEVEQHIHIICCIGRHICVFIHLIRHINVVSACKQHVHLWDRSCAAMRAPVERGSHQRHTNANSQTQSCSHHTAHTHHCIRFCIDKHMSSMYNVLFCIRSDIGMAASTYNVLCDVPTERRLCTGECVQSDHLLHTGGTKHPASKHGAYHHGRQHGVQDTDKRRVWGLITWRMETLLSLTVPGVRAGAWALAEILSPVECRSAAEYQRQQCARKTSMANTRKRERTRRHGQGTCRQVSGMRARRARAGMGMTRASKEMIRIHRGLC